MNAQELMNALKAIQGESYIEDLNDWDVSMVRGDSFYELRSVRAEYYTTSGQKQGRRLLLSDLDVTFGVENDEEEGG